MARDAEDTGGNFRSQGRLTLGRTVTFPHQLAPVIGRGA
jgi:hypothetical protein